MTQYLDSSALLSVILDEPRADAVRDRLARDAEWSTARHTLVEARRNIVRLVAPEHVERARRAFMLHWDRTSIIEVDADVCASAAALAERTGIRTLDALHLAAALRRGGSEIVMLTLDRRLWGAARSMGMPAPDLAGFEGG